MEDHGSYFVTTLNRTKRRKQKNKKYIYNVIATKILQVYIILSLSEKVFGLYSKKYMNWKIISLPKFQPLLNLLQL